MAARLSGLRPSGRSSLPFRWPDDHYGDVLHGIIENGNSDGADDSRTSSLYGWKEN